MKHAVTVFLLICWAPVQAFEWSDLWLNDYQKAQKLLQDQPAQAAEKFKQPEWQGIAKYNAGNYPEAAKNFSESSDIESEYNLGNALAKAGELEKSLESYNKLLEKPTLDKKLQEDATFNRDLVKKLLEEQQQQEQQQSSDESNQPDENEESQDGEQEGQQSNNPSDAEQNGSDSQDSQPSEQQDKPEAAEEQQSENGGEEKEGEQSEGEQRQGQANQDQPMTEDQQATEQWLRQIPDDPSGLLRRKLIQSHRTKYPQIQSGGQAW